MINVPTTNPHYELACELAQYDEYSAIDYNLDYDIGEGFDFDPIELDGYYESRLSFYCLNAMTPDDGIVIPF